MGHAHKPDNFVCQQNLGFHTEISWGIGLHYHGYQQICLYSLSASNPRVLLGSMGSPYYSELTQKVGKIQRRAARLVFSNYDWNVNELIRKLDLDMLSTRREVARLCILYSHGGGGRLPVQNYLQPVLRLTQEHTSSINPDQGLIQTGLFQVLIRAKNYEGLE